MGISNRFWGPGAVRKSFAAKKSAVLSLFEGAGEQLLKGQNFSIIYLNKIYNYTDAYGNDDGIIDKRYDAMQ